MSSTLSVGLILSFLLAHLVQAQTYVAEVNISSSYRDSTFAQSFGSIQQLTTVDAGVTVWLSGSGPHNFFGNVDTFGNIVVSQTDFQLLAGAQPGLISGYVGTGADTANGQLIINTGSYISLNDYGSLTGAAYNWILNTFSIYGTLQWCGRGDTGGSQFFLECFQDCYNYGLIDFEQYNGNLGAAYQWSSASLGTSVTVGGTTASFANTYNYGTFRIVRIQYHNVQNVLGTGCFVIGQDATLFLEAGTTSTAATGVQSFAGQSIYFGSTTSTLHFEPTNYVLRPNFGAQLYGFGRGNYIDFIEPFALFSPLSYSASAGTLTVNFLSGNKLVLNIGTGYTAANFATGLHITLTNPLGLQGVTYNGAAPAQSVPAKCQPTFGLCQDPISTVGALSTAPATSSGTSTSTSSTAATSTLPATLSTTLGQASCVCTPARVLASNGGTGAATATGAAAATTAITSAAAATTAASGAAATGCGNDVFGVPIPIAGCLLNTLTSAAGSAASTAASGFGGVIA